MVIILASSACARLRPVTSAFPIRTPTEVAPASPSPSATSALFVTAKPTYPSVPTATSQALPGPYESSLLNPLDTPHTYIQDICQYLHDKWSSVNSRPGTVVMVIMFHRITDATITTPEEISEYNFRRLIRRLHDNDFQAITTLQLDGFLEHNSKIPERSVLLVSDDKHTGDYFNAFFRQYWTDYGWPVVNAWISDDLTTADLWKQQEDLNAAGWVDYQAHGVLSEPITGDSPQAYILSELKGPIDVFREHFQKTPIAIIWPGGGFTPHAVSMARQLGYRLGFTINPRGPVMFNWVPLAEYGDPARDSWIPEGPVDDPLMVLPRYWDTDAIQHLDEVVQIGQEAAAYAEANKSIEMKYYDNACVTASGVIP